MKTVYNLYKSATNTNTLGLSHKPNTKQRSRSISIAHLDGIVSQSRDNFVVVILKAIDPFAILAATVDSLKVKSSHPPIVFYGVNILNDLGVEIAVVLVRRRGLVHGFVFEETLAPDEKKVSDLKIINQLPSC